MTEFRVVAVRLGVFTSHPNADSLDITRVFDYPVIVRKGEWKDGDLAAYVPVDSVVPDTDDWAFLAGHRRIRAKRLRGVFSMGLVTKLPPGDWQEGDDLRAAMCIEKYEPPENLKTGGEDEPDPKGWTFVKYTDIEGLRRWPDVLQEGEEVVLSEKLHGCNGRFVHDGTRLWVGSHNHTKRDDVKSVWWRAAKMCDMEEKLSRAPMHIFFGEVYGQVQDLKYGVKSGVAFKCFDVFDVKKMRYLDHDDAVALASSIGLEWVPLLHRGSWNAALSAFAEGKSCVSGADNVREGFVVKPVKERFDDGIGRVCLKMHGEGYLTRKGG